MRCIRSLTGGKGAVGVSRRERPHKNGSQRERERLCVKVSTPKQFFQTLTQRSSRRLELFESCAACRWLMKYQSVLFASMKLHHIKDFLPLPQEPRNLKFFTRLSPVSAPLKRL
ncbi:unnamed protein product [Pleuronectes platessa]|uniref:Uncharacterized protein n=1 Tax=Pleuronectes platessa TaxID=8262 RepID=A0A9N7YFC0_PLEPL|nr:unnamed protein product [Pleuronectes platessa]